MPATKKIKANTFNFQPSATKFYFDSSYSLLKQLVPKQQAVIVTDENVFKYHQQKFKGYNTIVLKPGEMYKVQATVDAVVNQLIELNADRNTILIGVGGGVITDLVGYVSAIYMRGLSCGFIPTTLLALVDASIGGKNGIDVGVYKNMVGTIRQPSFILHDYSFLKTLPVNEWQNGFAEIIKHACIKDGAMFKQLQQHDVVFYQKSKQALATLIKRNVLIKAKVVLNDPFEKGERKLLNYGHTLGHALENQYELSHGQAISIGMVYAAIISSSVLGFKQQHKVIEVLGQYGLPTMASFDIEKTVEVLKKDKKRENSEMNYILLKKIGEGVIHKLPVSLLHKMIQFI